MVDSRIQVGMSQDYLRTEITTDNAGNAAHDDALVDDGEAMNQAAMMMEQITAALTAPRAVIRDEFGNIVGSETVVQ